MELERERASNGTIPLPTLPKCNFRSMYACRITIIYNKLSILSNQFSILSNKLSILSNKLNMISNKLSILSNKLSTIVHATLVRQTLYFSPNSACTWGSYLFWRKGSSNPRNAASRWSTPPPRYLSQGT